MEQGSGLMGYLPFILIIGVFYFLIFRPQQQRAKRQKEMIEALAPGNEVMTAGGMIGRIESVNETAVRLEIAPTVVITLQKSAITGLLPPGTMASPEELPPPPPSCCA